MNPLEGFLLKAYLDGELDNEAAEAFELLLIERPDIAELVDADSALRIGLGQATVASATPAPSPVATAAAAVIEQAGQAQRIPAVVTDARFGRRRSFIYSPALAAGVMLALGLGAGYFAGRPVAGDMQTATLAYIDKTRDISAKPVIALPDGGAVVLLAPVATIDACVPEVLLRQAGASEMRANAVPDEFGYASFVVARSALRLGEATVEVRCGSAPVSHYAITFVSATAAGAGQSP